LGGQRARDPPPRHRQAAPLRRRRRGSRVSAATSQRPSVDALLDYWLHDSDAAATDAIDEHLMQCEACGDALDELIALGAGVRSAFRAGAVSAVTSDAFVQRLVGRGLQVREYRLPQNCSVNCTMAPDDELLVAHLETPLHGVVRLDALVRLSLDVVAFGATSFVGTSLCRYLLAEFGAGGELKWAMAGRSKTRLEELRDSLGAKAAGLPLMVADAADDAALRELCASARVVVSTV